MSSVGLSEFVERNSCPLCNSANIKIHIGFPDIPVARCLECDFLFSSRLMTTEALNNYYADGFGSLRHQQGQRVNAKINAWALLKLLDISPAGRLLDVGTGYGFFLKEVAKNTCLEVTGVELSKQEAEYGRETLKLNVINALLRCAGLEKESFDIVTSFEVIEHIPDPRSFIQELRSYLKTDGYLLIMTDNFESDLVKSMGAGFPKWIPHSHVSHFGATTFEDTFISSGFEVLKRFSYTPWELMVANFIRKAKGGGTPAEAFNLADTLKSEMHGTFKLFRTRLLLNRLWVQAQVRHDLNGAIMFVLARKV